MAACVSMSVSVPSVSTTLSDTAHPSMVTGRPGMSRRNLGCQRAPPHTPTAIHSLTHTLATPPSTHHYLFVSPCLSSVFLLSNTPMIVECQSPRPPILSGRADCNPTTHPLHLCRHTMESESCLLATNPSEKVAVVLKRRHESKRKKEVDRQRGR